MPSFPCLARKEAYGGSVRRCDDGRVESRTAGAADALLVRHGVAQSRVHRGQWWRAECAGALDRWRRAAADTGRRGAEQFEFRVRRDAAHLVARIAEEMTADAARLRDQWDVPPPRPAPDDPPVGPVPAPVLRRSPLETALLAVIGTGFALGVALGAGKLLSDVGVPGLLAGGVVGALTALWLVFARGLLHTRAVLDRWAAEVAATVRSHGDAVIVSRSAALEVDLLVALRRRTRE